MKPIRTRATRTVAAVALAAAQADSLSAGHTTAALTPANTKSGPAMSTPSAPAGRPSRRAKEAALADPVWMKVKPRKRANSPELLTESETKRRKSGASQDVSSSQAKVTKATKSRAPPPPVIAIDVSNGSDIGDGLDDKSAPVSKGKRAVHAVPPKSGFGTAVQLTGKAAKKSATCKATKPATDDESDCLSEEAETDSEGEQSELEDEDLENLLVDPDAVARQWANELPMWSAEDSIPSAQVGGQAGAMTLPNFMTPDFLQVLSRSVQSLQTQEMARAAKATISTGPVLTPIQAATPGTAGSSSNESGRHKSGWDKRRAVEEPVWKEEAAKQGATPAVDLDFKQGSNVNSDDGTTIEDIELVYPAQGGILQLTAQVERVRDVARASIDKVLIDVCFVDAFPDAFAQSKYAQVALIKCAEGLGYHDIVQRLGNDKAYAKALAALPTQRISAFRSKMKDKIDGFAMASHTLKPGCEKIAQWLLNDLRYIYPNDPEKQSLTASKPYRNPAIVNALRACFFSGLASMGNRFPELFISSLPEKPDENQIPDAMLAFVATGDHALISDWLSGQYKGTDFKAAAYADAYGQHIALLNAIKNKNPRGYHVMMRDLFNDMTANAAHSVPAVTVPGALAIIDFDAMDRD